MTPKRPGSLEESQDSDMRPHEQEAVLRGEGSWMQWLLGCAGRSRDVGFMCGVGFESHMRLGLTPPPHSYKQSQPAP